jgi:hypothetical protein
MGWSGALTGNSVTNTITMDSPKVINAVFGTQLNTAAAGNGSISVHPSAPLYPFGSTVRLTPMPNSGSYFGSWANAASGTSNPLSFTILNQNPTVAAFFAALQTNQVALTVLSDCGGQVSITPSTNRYSLGATAVLLPVPHLGQRFIGWSGHADGADDPLSLLLDSSKVVTAHFTRTPSLTISLGSGQAAQLNAYGVVGDAYRIESSVDLLSWETLSILTNVFGAVTAWDPISTDVPRRMYRAVVLE